jgi:sulfur-oxidizing protein SoxY
VSAVPAQASLVNETISKFTGGAEVVPGDIILDTPEIAENGNTVPIEVSAPGAASIMLLAAGNPVPAVATFNFGPLSGSRSGNTRIRLIKTQEVMAIAKMEDGSFKSTQATVKVTIGGCGG